MTEGFLARTASSSTLQRVLLSAMVTPPGGGAFIASTAILRGERGRERERERGGGGGGQCVHVHAPCVVQLRITLSSIHAWALQCNSALSL